MAAVIYFDFFGGLRSASDRDGGSERYHSQAVE